MNDLLERLVNIPQRETSGSQTSNRYDYQYHWSLLKLLEITQSFNDFLIIFEFCEDTIVLDSSIKPENIDFYQVKTKKQAKKLNWVLSDITKKKKDSKEESIIEKLIDNYNKYGKNVRSINLVSNLPFKFNDKIIQANSIIQLKELDEACIDKLKSQICAKCNKDNNNCDNKCLDIIYFNCSSLSIEKYESTLIGELAKFLLESKASNINPTALYKTLISEIKTKSKVENVNNVNELIKLKSFTKEEFYQKLKQYDEDCKLYNNWNSLDSSLVKLYNLSKIKQIRKAFYRFKEDSLDSSNTYLEKVIANIRDLLADNINEDFNDEDLKRFFDDVVENVINKLDVSKNTYDKDYILSIVIREYFNG